MKPDLGIIDDAVLAMLFLTSHRDRKDAPGLVVSLAKDGRMFP